MVAKGRNAARPWEGPRNQTSMAVQKLGCHLEHLEAIGDGGWVHMQMDVHF